METFLLTFIILAIAICGLAVGVIAGRPPIKGSCGGLACRKGFGCRGCAGRTAGEGAE